MNITATRWPRSRDVHGILGCEWCHKKMPFYATCTTCTSQEAVPWRWAGSLSSMPLWWNKIYGTEPSSWLLRLCPLKRMTADRLISPSPQENHPQLLEDESSRNTAFFCWSATEMYDGQYCRVAPVDFVGCAPATHLEVTEGIYRSLEPQIVKEPEQQGNCPIT